MRGVAEAFALGLLVGVIFAAARQPVPAPSTWAGIAGVVGLFVGWSVMSWVVARRE